MTNLRFRPLIGVIISNPGIAPIDIQAYESFRPLIGVIISNLYFL